jgi:signal recognition particle GTPase
MNEEPKVFEEPVVTEEPVAGETPAADKSIADELARLGKQVADAVKAAWESEDRKKIQADVADGLQKFSQEVSSAFERATESEQAREVRVKAEKVADDIAKSDVVGEVRKGIVSGLEVVNRELSRLLERLETKAAETEPVGSVPATPVDSTPEVGGSTPSQPPAE